MPEGATARPEQDALTRAIVRSVSTGAMHALTSALLRDT